MNSRADAEVTSRPTEDDIFSCPGPVVLPVYGQPGWFDVRVSESFYRCFVGSKRKLPRCECPDHVNRKLGTRTPCKHLDAALEFVARGRQAVADQAMQWYLSLSEEERKAIW